MVLWKLIVGIILILFTVSTLGISIVKTPDNLQGYYGLMYAVIGLAGLIGGIILIVTAFVA